MTIFRWNEKFDHVNKMMKDNFSIRRTSNYLKAYDPANLCWLAEYIPGIGNKDEEILSNVVKHFKDFYKKVTLYHACCPERLDDYYKNGIVKLDMHQQCDLFKSLIKRVDDEYCEVELNRICEEQIVFFKDLPDNFHEQRSKVYCFLDKNYLLCDGKEFYEDGSEFLRTMISHLSNQNLRNNILDHIHTNYVPTIFHLNLSLECLGNENVNDIVRHIIWKWAGIYLADDPQNFILDHGYDINASIDAEWISKHEHPRQAVQFNNLNEVPCDKCKKRIKR